MKNEQLTMFHMQGEEKGKKQLIESIGKKLQEERTQLVRKMKPELIEFCLELCEQILRQALAQPEVLAKKIASLLDALAMGQEPLSVILSPEDLEMIDEERKRWGGFFFCADPTLERGDIRIESPAIIVNCVLKRELANLRTHLIKGGE